MFRSLVLTFALLLSLVAVSYADVYTTASVPVQTADAPYDVGRSSYIHNALYFETALGFRYLNLDDTYYDESSYSFEKDRVYETDFSGFGPEFYARLGGVFSSRIALFGFLGIASMKSADYEYVEHDRNGVHYVEENSEGGIRFTYGAGLDVYFVRDPSNSLYGLYAGFFLGFVYYYLGDDDSAYDNVNKTSPWKDSYYSELATSVGFEFGKLWYLTNMWNAGFGAEMTFDFPDRVDEDEDNDNTYYTLSFKIMLVRK